MERKEWKVKIDAPKEKVWNVLWDDSTYPEWTKAFSETSVAETDWKEGSKVKFHDGKGNGMVSKIEQKRPNEFMSFRHLGMIKDGKEVMDSPEVKQWAGALENYTLKGENGNTELTVQMDIGEVGHEMHDFFMNAWPKALDRVKELAEHN